jgi:hypothetical protein
MSQSVSYSNWVLTNEPKCLHRRWYSGDKTMERRWLDSLGMCGVRNSDFTLRIEIVGAFPTHYRDFLQQRIQTGNRYFVRNVHVLHKTKCCAFQHFHVILPTYLKEEEALLLNTCRSCGWCTFYEIDGRQDKECVEHSSLVLHGGRLVF